MTIGRSSARELVLVGMWLGLAYGMAEAVESCLLRLLPGGLTWQTGNSARILWVAPAVYGFAGVVLGLSAAALRLLMRRVDWTVVLVFVALVGGSYFGARLQPRVFPPLSAALLAAGIATQLTRVFLRRRERWISLAHRTVLPLAALVGLIAFAEITASAALEKWALVTLPPADARPNILILVADTLRADHLSGYGYQRPTTPQIDRLARDGRLFVNAYSDSSWTLPSHASIFTGRRLSEHHAGDPRRLYLDGHYATLAEVLRDAGYASGGFVGNIFWCGRQSGLARGFIHYEDYYGSVSDAVARTAIGRMLFYQVLSHFGFVDIPGRKTAADINNRLLRWIDTVEGRPFFAFANYLDVHRPNLPPRSHMGRFGGQPLDDGTDEIALGGGADEATVPAPAVLQSRISAYDESLLYLDEEVGRLVDELTRRHLLDRTIIVFTADHGEGLGEHNLVGHGNSLYRDQIRIPLIVRFPSAVAHGTRDETPVALDQIPALVTRLAGLSHTPFPHDSPLVNESAGQEAVVSEVGKRPGFPRTWPTTSNGFQSLQTKQFQLIVSENGAVELYDLRSDPAQSTNLARDSRFSDVVSQLHQRLTDEVRVLPVGSKEEAQGGEARRGPAETPVPVRTSTSSSAAPTDRR